MNKIYFCKKIDNDILVDGNVNKLEWANIEEVSLKENITGDYPKMTTHVKAIWNEKFLYFLFNCNDNFVKATMTEFNDKLYEEDVVEIFLDDDNDLKTYIEIEVNPLNAVLHYNINNNLKGDALGYARVDKCILSAVRVINDSSVINYEIAIPFSEFVTALNSPPKIGDSWGINLFRIDRGNDSVDEYSAWSPTGVLNFHKPSFFGKIVFISATVTP